MLRLPQHDPERRDAPDGASRSRTGHDIHSTTAATVCAKITVDVKNPNISK